MRALNRNVTDRGLEVLAFVWRRLDRYGEAPTRAEIGRALRMSAPTAQAHLQVLEREGLVRLHTQWRGIEVREAGVRRLENR